MNDDWITQPYIYTWIKSQLPFKMILDLAADRYNSKCAYFIDKERDALKQDWNSLLIRAKNLFGPQGTFCNPPYSKPNLLLFTKKACLEAKKGLNQCFLVPLDITSWSRNYVWGQSEVWIPDERIAFIDSETGKPQTQPPKGSIIVIYGPLAQKGLIKPVHIPKLKGAR